MQLHGYYRSSAAYRVRIALALKGLAVEHVAHHLRRGEQHAPAYLALNPQGFVPTLVTDDGAVLTQSLAIIEWLEETWPQPPLLPAEPLARAQVRALALVIACDTHPVQNLKVLNRLRGQGIDQAGVSAWQRWVIEEGFGACEALLAGGEGPLCFGANPTLADICLVAQMPNARRAGVDMTAFPRLAHAVSVAEALPAFAAAAPERQADAE